MELATTFERLLGYDRWANGEALASLEALAEPPAKARELLGHLLGAEVCWLDRMTAGRDPKDWARWEDMDVSSLRRAWQDELPGRWSAFRASSGLSEPERAFSFVDFLGNTGTACVDDVLLTLLLHSAYHRGQVASHVRAAGGTPAVTDFRHGVRTGAVPAAARR